MENLIEEMKAQLKKGQLAIIKADEEISVRNKALETSRRIKNREYIDINSLKI